MDADGLTFACATTAEARVAKRVGLPTARVGIRAANAAEGSKPEWMPQCSQRGSLPGPYASHSIPSSSASYVGKMPSVRR